MSSLAEAQPLGVKSQQENFLTPAAPLSSPESEVQADLGLLLS